MLRGHGDDGYAQPTEIKHDFSSNVCREALPEGLLEHLRQGLEGLSHYPEPASESLRATIARREGVTPASVLVTNGATEAIYLAAQAFPKRISYVLQPTFRSMRMPAGSTVISYGVSDGWMKWGRMPRWRGSVTRTILRER